MSRTAVCHCENPHVENVLVCRYIKLNDNNESNLMEQKENRTRQKADEMNRLEIEHNRPSPHTRDKTPYLVKYSLTQSKVMYGPAPALGLVLTPLWARWGQHANAAADALPPVSGCVYFPSVSVRRPLPLSEYVCVSACTPKCRLMPCRTDRLNANPWVVPKPAPGSKLWVRVWGCVSVGCVCACLCVCLCVCLHACPASYKCMPVSLPDWVNIDIKQLPLVNNSKGHCRFQIVYILQSCPDGKETFLALMSDIFRVSVHFKTACRKAKINISIYYSNCTKKKI